MFQPLPCSPSDPCMVCGGLEGYGAVWGSDLHTGGPLPGVSGITVGPVTMSPIPLGVNRLVVLVSVYGLHFPPGMVEVNLTREVTHPVNLDWEHTCSEDTGHNILLSLPS